jgi:hypothetical protein
VAQDDPFGPYYWVNDGVLQQNIRPTTAFDKPKTP